MLHNACPSSSYFAELPWVNHIDSQTNAAGVQKAMARWQRLHVVTQLPVDVHWLLLVPRDGRYAANGEKIHQSQQRLYNLVQILSQEVLSCFLPSTFLGSTDRDSTKTGGAYCVGVYGRSSGGSRRKKVEHHQLQPLVTT